MNGSFQMFLAEVAKETSKRDRTTKNCDGSSQEPRHLFPNVHTFFKIFNGISVTTADAERS